MRPVTARVTTANPVAMVRLDQYHGAACAVSVVIESGTGGAAYAIDYSFDDPNDLVNPIPWAPVQSKSPLHYSPNINFDGNGNFLPGGTGFNLADAGSPGLLAYVPAGIQALPYLGYTAGNDATFRSLVATFTGAVGANKIWGWYLVDNVGNGLQANLAAEADYLHSLVPSLPVFLEQQNLGPNDGPFVFPYNPANSHCDYFGIAAYPVQTNVPNNLDYTVIPRSVTAAIAQGIPLNQIIPIYQAFGGGPTTFTSYILPTAAQEWTILQYWQSAMAGVIPPFDYAYAWGQQGDDQPLSTATALLPVFSAFNGRSVSSASSMAWDNSLIPSGAHAGTANMTFVIPTAPIWARVQLLAGGTSVRAIFTQYEAHRTIMVAPMPPSQMLTLP
jgi:hypothetical protein